MLTTPGIQRLTLKHDQLLLNFCFQIQPAPLYLGAVEDAVALEAVIFTGAVAGLCRSTPG